jgi:UDP:flavonoid glycosyltransferase YjiC (YdhE family)
MARRRILFLAEGATMAHFVRPLALAEALDSRRHEIFFYAPARFAPYLKNKPFAIGELASMPGELFLANIAKGAPLFPSTVIRGYVEEERRLFQELQPDLVIGDMRLSLPISARLDSIRHAVMINAYWSPYARHRSVVPSLPLTRVVPPRALAPIFKITEPLAYAVHVGQVNRVRKHFGVPKLPPDIRILYTEGDYILYADIPEFVPVSNAPDTHRYVGICPWTPPARTPDWWTTMLEDPKPKVFVSLGSSGPLRAMPALIRALSRLPVAVVLSTSGRRLPGTETALYQADLRPFTDTAAHAQVVVSHGGSGGLYPAIAAGTPVLAIPSNADQHLSTAFLEESGAGLGVRVEEASEKRLYETLERLLCAPRYREAAQRWAAVYARYDSASLFREFVSDTLGE